MKIATSYIKWLCMLFAVAFASLEAKADAYFENFETTKGAVYVLALPDGWGCIGSLSSFEHERDKYHSVKHAIAIHPNTSNYLVTPKLAAGDFSLYLRQYTKSYAASAKLYLCTEVDGEFVLGEQIGTDASLAKGATEWTLFKYSLASDSRVAILFDGVLDDFVAVNGLSTQSDEPAEEKHLTITDFMLTSDANAEANEMNLFSASFNVTVRNTGNVALAAEEIGVSILDGIDDDGESWATAMAETSLGVDETMVIPVEVKNMEAGEGGLFRFYARENLEGTIAMVADSAMCQTVSVTPYVGVFQFADKDADCVMEDGATIAFGDSITDVVSHAFEVRNLGIGVLQVKSIKVPEGFTASVNAFTLGRDESQEVIVSLTPEKGHFGSFGGEVLITHSCGKFAFNVTATVKEKHLVVTDFTRTSDEQVKANEQNQFSASFAVKVQNSGNAVLAAEEVSVSILQAATDGALVYATASATEPLMPGQEATIVVDVTDVDAAEGGVFTFYAKENVDDTYASAEDSTIYHTVSVTPYVAAFAIYAESAETEMEEGETIDFGEDVESEVAKTFVVRNAGTAPLEVMSITVPEGFVVTPETLTVEGEGEATFTISFTPQEEVYGTFAGEVIVSHALGTFSFRVSATVKEPETAIGTIRANATADAYLLNGQRATTHQKGIRVVKGKKSVVK